MDLFDSKRQERLEAARKASVASKEAARKFLIEAGILLPNGEVAPHLRQKYVGAIIDLGYCFDLTDSAYLQELKDAYESMVELYKESELELPQNTPIGKSTDLLIRKLDCAVVQTALTYNKKANAHPYDSVKGVFWEGQELYPNAGFREKNHIQICVCNPNCIKGYFLPRGINQDYPNP